MRQIKRSESSIDAAINRHAREKRGLFVTKQSPMNNTGLPDRIYWIPGGRPLIAEIKRKGAKPTPKQCANIERLRRLGYDVYVFDDVEEAKRVIDDSLIKAGVIINDF